MKKIVDWETKCAADMRIREQIPTSDPTVRCALTQLAWNMRDRANEHDRTSDPKQRFHGEVHSPITSDTLRAFADEVERIAFLGLQEGGAE